MAFPSFRTASTPVRVDDSTLTLDVPSGYQPGDILFAAVAAQETFTPSGWTLLGEYEDINGVGIGLYWRKAAEGEPASYTFSVSTNSANGALGVIVAYETPEAADPFDGFAHGEGPGSFGDQVPSMTTSNDDETVIVVSATAFDPTGVFISTPAGTTSRVSFSGGTGATGYWGLRWADFTQVSAGSTGVKDFGTNHEGQASVGIAMIPVSSNPPNAPSLSGPVAGEYIATDVSQRFEWAFSDPDSSDVQSAYDLRYRVVGAGSWTTVSGGSDEFHDFAAATFTDDTNYEWQVRTTDNFGTVGPYSSSETFVAVAPPAPPSITDPVTDVNTDPYSVKWTTPENQSSYQVRTVADSAGSPDTGTIYYDSGPVSSSSKSHSTPFPTNGRAEHVQVRVKSQEGLWSDYASQSVDVAYVRPAVPTLTVSADSPVAGAIRVSQTHPTPQGAEPTVTSVDLFRREALVGGDGIRIAAGFSPADDFDSFTSRSGVAYEFRVTALGDNATTESSAWTS